MLAVNVRPLKTYEVHLLFVTGLYVLGLAVYSNSLSGPFVLDDYPNIRENPSIRMTGIDVDALYRAGFESVDTQPPLAYISFALNYYFGDYDVFAYHLVNVLLHIANGVLLYFLVLLIGRAEGSNQTPWAWVAFVAGVIFLVHPIQTQAVTYIVQRITSLAAFFYLLALLLYGLGRLNPALGKRVVLWCFAGFSGLCALATKETALSLPLAILLWSGISPRKLDSRCSHGAGRFCYCPVRCWRARCLWETPLENRLARLTNWASLPWLSGFLPKPG